VRQLEYYFSPANFGRDAFLQQQMDGDGYVPLSLLNGFNRMRRLEMPVSEVATAVVSLSSALEVDEARERVRAAAR